MKKCKLTILLMLLLSSLGAAFGQSKVYDVPVVQSDTSIVRYWQNDISIVYSRSYESHGDYFLLVDESSPSVLQIAVPTDVTVRDFRILHDTVFLAGYYKHALLGIQYGLLACFAINDFYVGSGSYHWMVTDRTPMCDCYNYGCVNHIYDIMRLVVYDSSGYTRIGFIARNYILGETTRRVGIGTAKFYSHGSGLVWDCHIIYNKYAIEEYTDIVATQNYVVAVGRTNDSARLALRAFPKSMFIYKTGMSNLPNDCVYYHDKYGQGFADIEVDGDVMATAMDDDEIAVAYHYRDGSTEGLAVKTIDFSGGSASLIQGMTAPTIRQPGSTWMMRDIRFFSPSKMLAVLNDFDGGTAGGQESIVYRFLASALVTGFYYGHYLPQYSLYSLDPYGSLTDAFITSGNRMSAPLSLYWELLTFPAGCGQQDAILGKEGSPAPYSRYMETNINLPIHPSGDEPFVVTEIDRQEVCGRGSQGQE